MYIVQSHSLSSIRFVLFRQNRNLLCSAQVSWEISVATEKTFSFKRQHNVFTQRIHICCRRTFFSAPAYVDVDATKYIVHHIVSWFSSGSVFVNIVHTRGTNTVRFQVHMPIFIQLNTSYHMCQLYFCMCELYKSIFIRLKYVIGDVKCQYSLLLVRTR